MDHQEHSLGCALPNRLEARPSYMTPGDGLSLAMAYVPDQEWEHVYDADVGLTRGTIFRQLDLPFDGGDRR